MGLVSMRWHWRPCYDAGVFVWVIVSLRWRPLAGTDVLPLELASLLWRLRSCAVTVLVLALVSLLWRPCVSESVHAMASL